MDRGCKRDCSEQQHVRGMERERMGIVSRAGKGNYARRQVRSERKYGEKARSVSRAFVTELRTVRGKIMRLESARHVSRGGEDQ